MNNPAGLLPGMLPVIGIEIREPAQITGSKTAEAALRRRQRRAKGCREPPERRRPDPERSDMTSTCPRCGTRSARKLARSAAP